MRTIAKKTKMFAEPKTAKQFDPEGVQEFLMWEVDLAVLTDGKFEGELWHYRPVGEYAEPIEVDEVEEQVEVHHKRTSEEHAEAVENLRKFYEPFVKLAADNPNEDYPSPFDYEHKEIKE